MDEPASEEEVRVQSRMNLPPKKQVRVQSRRRGRSEEGPETPTSGGAVAEGRSRQQGTGHVHVTEDCLADCRSPGLPRPAPPRLA